MKTEMSSTKKNMITQHQPLEEKRKINKLVLVNHHVPQTPPHVYQINLVILVSRQPHTIKIKKKKKKGRQNLETLLSNNTAWPDMSLEAKQNKHKGGTHLPSVVCCKRSFFLIHFTCVLNKPSSSCHTDTPHHPFDFVKTLDIEKKKARNNTFMTPQNCTRHENSKFLFLSRFLAGPKTKRKKKEKNEETQTATTTYFSVPPFYTLHCFPLFFFTRKDNEKSHPEVIPGNEKLRWNLFFFFLHTHDTHVHRKTRTNKAAPWCIDTAQAHRAQEVVYGLALRKS